MNTEIVRADLGKPEHQQAILSLMDGYAQDPMGDGKPLGDFARTHLIAGLRALPTTLVFLAYLEGQPVGIANCFRGFSTFAARPLINIHDFFVVPAGRGQGVGGRLLAAIEAEARATGCCKLTLEVQENNRRARRIYHTFGFSQTVHVAEAGGALFLSKPLDGEPAP